MKKKARLTSTIRKDIATKFRIDNYNIDNHGR